MLCTIAISTLLLATVTPKRGIHIFAILLRRELARASHTIKSHGGLLIGVPENRTALSAKPKNCSKSTRPSSVGRAGSGNETTNFLGEC